MEQFGLRLLDECLIYLIFLYFSGRRRLFFIPACPLSPYTASFFRCIDPSRSFLYSSIPLLFQSRVQFSFTVRTAVRSVSEIPAATVFLGRRHKFVSNKEKLSLDRIKINCTKKLTSGKIIRDILSAVEIRGVSQD